MRPLSLLLLVGLLAGCPPRPGPGQLQCADRDADGICDPDDACPDGPNDVDADGDGVANACDPCPGEAGDPDADGDGVCDGADRCPGGDDRQDADGDTRPNACDPCPYDAADDADGDGSCDSDDLCPGHPDGEDLDGDGTPDGCDDCPALAGDADSDGDGVCDSEDRCPGFDNRRDDDDDGVSACDEGCASEVDRQVFRGGMVGCTGAVAFDARDDLCGPRYRACSALEWVGLREGLEPEHNYWTDDALQVLGEDGRCAVSVTNGASCSDAPMRVCTPSGSDGSGNDCGWSRCGYEQHRPNEYFGGCDSDATAGTLCCPR